MSLRDRMYLLTTPEEVEEFLEKFPTSAFFKAGACHKTMQGFGYVEASLDPYEQVHVGFVKVIEHRPASNHIAEKTGVIHQSPQLILMIDGKSVWDIDNWDITPEALNQALSHHLGAPSSAKKEGDSSSDLSLYKELLRQFCAGEMEENAFKEEWLTVFRDDAAPRSTSEFNLINSLFGDVDAALESHYASAGGLGMAKPQISLRDRAEKLLNQL